MIVPKIVYVLSVSLFAAVFPQNYERGINYTDKDIRLVGVNDIATRGRIYVISHFKQ